MLVLSESKFASLFYSINSFSFGYLDFSFVKISNCIGKNL